MTSRILIPLLTAALFVLPGSSSAQTSARDTLRDDRSFSFYDRGPFRSGVPRPDSTLGYRIGELNTQYHQQERVLLSIAAAAPDRVTVEEYGTSTEGRTMRLFIVSSPENTRRLAEIQADLQRLADPRTTAAAELDALAARTPAVVWLSFSVHGNESPGFETVMPLLYHLAASEEPATVAALRNAVVVLNPSANPDGHERFAVWYNSVGVGDPNPGASEHREPWAIQGRFNHYRFDMNRDVIASTQREVQAMLRVMHRWRPQIAVDLHGMTSQYFFPPAARPVNQHIGAESARWLDVIGRGNAAAFDRYGWLYYVRDVFDLYYPGYWDSWPSLTGATGMTYETDGGGWKGLLWRRDDGTMLSFRDGIAKHFVAALATVETTAGRSADRVRDYVAARRAAIDEGRRPGMQRVILVPGDDPARANELAAALLRAGVEVRWVPGEYSAARANSYADDAAGARRFRGVYLVDLAQPQGRVARALLEPVPTLDPEFAREQLERYRRNLLRARSTEDYEFYDVTAWSLPIAFGVEAYWTADAPAIQGTLLTLPADTTILSRRPLVAGGRAAMLQPELTEPAMSSGIVSGERARTAYVFGPERSGANALAYRLMAEGVRLTVSTAPIEAGGRRWPRGTFVVRVTRNDERLHELIDRLAREAQVEVRAVQTAYTDESQFGVASGSVRSLRLPRIAMLGDDGVGQTSYGAIWWTLERRYGIPFTPVSLTYLSGGDLSEFNVIIMPDANPGTLGSRLGKTGADRLRQWVQGGGTLITMGGASAWAAGEEANLTSARRVGGGEERDTTGIAAITADRDTLALVPVRSPTANNASPAYVPGAHFDVLLDRTHWLTHGMERQRMTVMMEGSTFLRLSREGTNVGVFPSTGRLHRAGFIYPDNTERLLRGTAFLIAERTGSGNVVVFANEPMFRGWWRALDKVVLNAVVLGPGL